MENNVKSGIKYDKEMIFQNPDEPLKKGYKIFDISKYIEIGQPFGDYININNFNRFELTLIIKLDIKFIKGEISEKTIDNILDKLKLNFIDILILYYRPFIDYKKIWKILEKCVLSNKIKKLGLYSFNITEIKDILNISQIKPSFYKMKFDICSFNDLYYFAEMLNQLGINIILYHSKDNNKKLIYIFSSLNQIKTKFNFIKEENQKELIDSKKKEIDNMISNYIEQGGFSQAKNFYELNNLINNFENIVIFKLVNEIEEINKRDKKKLKERLIPLWSNKTTLDNNLEIYNMCVLDNIMSYNSHFLEFEALDYFGFKIKYKELPIYVENYMKGLLELGINENDIVTVCLPNTIEVVLITLALNKLQIISNNVFLVQLIDDFEEFTTNKNSNILITLDGYLQYFYKQLENSKIKKIVIVSLKDFLPENKKYLFEDPILEKSADTKFLIKNKINEGINKCKKYKNIELVNSIDIFNNGKKSKITIKSQPIDLEKDISYFYTSGSTGKPKCVVFKNKSYSSFFEMSWNYFPNYTREHFKNFFPTNLDKSFIDSSFKIFQILSERSGYLIEPGLRFFSNIRMSHMTGERACIFSALIHSLTIVIYPVYDEKKIYKDISKLNCNIVFLSGTRLMMGVKLGRIFPFAYKGLKLVVSVGEPIINSNLIQIDQWLKDNGFQSSTLLGYGTSESGNGTLLNFRLSNDNDFYYYDKYTRIKILKENGEEAGINEIGFLHVSIPTSADRYLNDPVETRKRWYCDTEGTRWENTMDLALRKQNNSIEVFGRYDDYIVDNGRKIFFFEKRNLLDFNDPIYEWEISSFFIKKENHYHIVGQIILKENIEEKNSDLIKRFCRKYDLNSIKFYKVFYKNQITEKRDFARIRNDLFYYYSPCDEDDEYLYKFTYLKEGDYHKEKVRCSIIDNQNIICFDY